MTTVKNKSANERRRSFRISPPPGLVREIAVWFRPPPKERILPLKVLRAPDLVSRNGNGPLTLENSSSTGMALRVRHTLLPEPGSWGGKFLYTYFKLVSPLPGKHTILPLFLGAMVAGISIDKYDTRLHCRFVQRGAPETGKKSLTMFSIERAGVKELTVWGDEILRMGRGILPPISLGLNLEYLLDEIENLETPPSLAQEPKV